MFKNIPLHSLVVCVGSSPERRAASISEFSDHEILSIDRISRDVFGAPTRPEMTGMLFAELRRRLTLKLEHGERVVVDAPNLRREDRVTLARIGLSLGVPVFYLVCPEDETTRTPYEAEARTGEGVAEVVDLRRHTARPVPRQPLSLTEIRERFAGITVIGDVHGMHQSLLAALAWARSRNHFIILLGDVIDYGPGTLAVADEVYRMVMSGQAEVLIGNHERKIGRWIAQIERGGRADGIRLSEGNRVTTDALAELSPAERARWQGRFRGLLMHARVLRSMGNIILAHASVHPDHWGGHASQRDIENYAIFGEFEDTGDGESGRRYTWVDALPAGVTAIVGHDIRSFAAPFSHAGAAGGLGIFLDTGSGKGGTLSSVDLKFVDDGTLRVANFNMH